MTPELLAAAGFRPCAKSPKPFWPGDEFAPLYMRRLSRGPAIYVHCPLERPEEVVAFVGDWDRPQRYCEGSIGSVEHLMHQLGFEMGVLAS
jgi:hypothetical protein